MKKKMKFCFDIDNIICLTNNSDYKKSKPIKDNIKLINNLKSQGHIIKIFTARFMGRNYDNQKIATKKAKKFTIDQLKKWNLKYDSIFFGKPSSDIYIDDKNLEFKKTWKSKLKKYLK